MKSLFLTLALTAAIVVPANAPMVAASETTPVVEVVTVSGSAGINI